MLKELLNTYRGDVEILLRDKKGNRLGVFEDVKFLKQVAGDFKVIKWSASDDPYIVVSIDTECFDNSQEEVVDTTDEKDCYRV